MLDRIYRLWVEIDPSEHGPALPMPTYAKPATIRLEKESLSFELNPCPHRGALLSGKRWAVQATNYKGLFSGVLSKPTGILKPKKSGYTLDNDDLKTAELIAYATDPISHKSSRHDNLTGTQIRVLPLKTPISAPNQMRVQSGAAVEVSPNLVGQRITLEVGYAEAVTTAPEPAKSLTAHLVGILGDAFYHLGISGCSYKVAGRSLQLTFNSEQSRLIKLCEMTS